VILDANAVSALLTGEPGIGNVVAASERHELPLPVIAEYSYGMLISQRQRRMAALFRHLEAHSDVLYPDRNTAEVYASILAELRENGRPIPESDLWIAALARQYSIEIVSNDRHFDLVDGIRRITW
jgi:tRNA(fMet)-specific endonuclease VapC